MRTGFTSCVVLACLVVFASAPVEAELVRVPVGSSTLSGVPDTFEECMDRISATHYDVSWVEQPRYDAYYTGTGGATYAYVSLSDGTSGTTADVTWLEFDSEEAAEQQVVDMLNSYGPDSYIRFASRGVHYMQVYVYSYDPVEAAALMDQLMGAAR